MGEGNHFARDVGVVRGAALAAHRLVIDCVDEHDAVTFRSPKIA